jgi:uncharacterized membrane protein YfcA
MHVLLPVAGLSISAPLLIAAGGLIGILCGLLGVGGGFLLTPMLMTVGVPPVVAAASGTNAILATSSSGVAAHFRLKNVDVRMGVVALAGGIAGSLFGVRIMEKLEATGSANLVISVAYIVLLGAVGGFIVRDSVRKWRAGAMPQAGPRPRRFARLAALPWQMEFPHSGVRHSILLPFVLCVIVGLMTAVMGVGGGFMLVPLMVYLLDMPAHVAVGTSLFQILFTCLGATLLQSGLNHTVDVVLALLVAAGSTIGAQIGARMSRWLRGDQLMGLLGVLALVVMLKMAVGLALPPDNLLKHPAGSVAFVTRPVPFTHPVLASAAAPGSHARGRAQ